MQSYTCFLIQIRFFFKCVFQNLQKNQNETRKRTKFIQAIDCFKKNNLKKICSKCTKMKKPIK